MPSKSISLFNRWYQVSKFFFMFKPFLFYLSVSL
jgi:hypothetical protein